MKKEQTRKGLIFLTGCINPDGMSFTKLQDPFVRRIQYIEAINFYLNKTSLEILFVENSDNDISNEFSDIISTGRLEVLTFDGNRYDKKLGKGYGEMLIIEHAVRNSLLMKRSNFIIKITGRYKLLNICSYIRKIERKSDINIFINLKNEILFADSRFWGANSYFFNEILLKYIGKINDSNGYLFEHALFEAVQEGLQNNLKVSPLTSLPRFSGIYGTDNVAFNDSWIHWFPRNIKYFLKSKKVIT